MTGELTVGSLFSGIGGLELGLERAGMRVVWQVEKDEYCRGVLAKHWPEVGRFEDVKDVGAHNLKPVDLICGGFPCQDISYAGQGAGLSGARSGLWYEYARIVGELGPRFVVVENVTALLTRGLDAVLGTLASLGYDAEWECVSAASVGAFHERDRVFIVAHAPLNRWAIGRSGNEGLHTSPQGEKQLRVESERSGTDGSAAPLAHPERPRLEGQRGPREDRAAGHRRAPGNLGAGSSGVTLPHTHGISASGPTEPRSECGKWLPEPDVGRVANGVPSRIHRLKALGNAVVPQVAEYIGRLIVEADKEMRGAA